MPTGSATISADAANRRAYGGEAAAERFPGLVQAIGVKEHLIEIENIALPPFLS
jgi:hypothetical protein